MNLDEIVKLDTEITEGLKQIPNFHVRHIERSPLLHKYQYANETFAYVTFTLHKNGTMMNYTSYDLNCIALRAYELQECSELKKQLEKIVRYGKNEQLAPSIKLVNQI